MQVLHRFENFLKQSEADFSQTDPYKKSTAWPRVERLRFFSTPTLVTLLPRWIRCFAMIISGLEQAANLVGKISEKSTRALDHRKSLMQVRISPSAQITANCNDNVRIVQDNEHAATTKINKKEQNLPVCSLLMIK